MKSYEDFKHELAEKELFGRATIDGAPEHSEDAITIAEGFEVSSADGVLGTVVAHNDEFVLYEGEDGLARVAVSEITEAKDKNVKGDDEEYEKFFRSALKKFGVEEPDQLEGDKKKEFFDYVDANWKGDKESD